MANKSIDWEVVEREYRTGLYSNRQLAKRHNVSEATIRRKRREGSWEKDLSGKVKSRLKDKESRLVSGKVLTGEDEQIVEQAAEEKVGVITNQRGDLTKMRSLVAGFMAKLQAQLNQDYITIESKGKSLEIDLPLDYTGKSLNHAANAMKTIHELERKVYRLDEDDKAGSYDEALNDLHQQIKEASLADA
ncbi:hypothetical protein J7384_17875 [Endozoicomonas sp. G2_1]|uniref:hypothetical protein n=1 Tax=Endozoicomonas sp. G2_1 TaxID=2821091 RepID=UPI001ADA994E|nr:hypothetical protein [Endozoicomonas sp. G2_1]MBO9492235.1 hypothetical protein [Endozoicomonas sp. G2_1]